MKIKVKVNEYAVCISITIQLLLFKTLSFRFFKNMWKNWGKIVNVPKHGIPPIGKIKKLKSMGNEYYQKLRILIRKLDKYK